jgi:phosphomannomutase
MIDKKIIIFDLDGTLAESKQSLDHEMALLLEQLVKEYKVAVISGGSFAQFEKQFLPNLHIDEAAMSQLILLPTSGTAMYRYRDGGWQKEYSEDIPKEDRKAIITALEEAITRFNLEPAEKFGELIEDRGSEITYSGLGQLAPLELKKNWDPDHSKRIQVIEDVHNNFPSYQFALGGVSTIDVTKKGVDKAYGIHKLESVLGVPIQEMVFVGDALYVGGNDYPATTTGIECIEVKTVEDTKKYIESWIRK